MGLINIAACCDMTLGKRCASFGCSVCQFHCWDFCSIWGLATPLAVLAKGRIKDDEGEVRKDHLRPRINQLRFIHGLVFLIQTVRLMLELKGIRAKVEPLRKRCAWPSVFKSWLPLIIWRSELSIGSDPQNHRPSMSLQNTGMSWRVCAEVRKEEENQTKLLGDWKMRCRRFNTNMGSTVPSPCTWLRIGEGEPIFERLAFALEEVFQFWQFGQELRAVFWSTWSTKGIKGRANEFQLLRPTWGQAK